ncbi:MAG TPA: gamma-glutamyl-gamma-aminobutyrate hydrolase family protein [Steroidobacteraceae bacterium]|jgi:putative glutamine amidotransferase|nr:gamma-glutamyl-gamma-aminobutyrate hydrolase family protein [Steroidobacteraceae bacterium]
MLQHKPLVGIPADRKLLGHHHFHCVGEKYIRALIEGANVVPVLIPSLGSGEQLDALVARLDGIVLPGSPSHVEPHHYGGDPSPPGTPHDPQRDATTLPLIPRIVAAGMPLLAICRGFQEMNVAYGGTLWPKVHEVPGFNDHREDESAELDVQYGPSHPVTLRKDGVLHRIANADQIMVNSLHWQGVRTLATPLDVEATSPDGLVEAFSVRGAKSLAVGVQWHPEWKMTSNDFSRALFAEFGKAAYAHANAGQV